MFVCITVSDFEDIQKAGMRAYPMFGTTRWCGTINGMPAITLSYWSGATVCWFDDGVWYKSTSFRSLRALHDRLGVFFT